MMITVYLTNLGKYTEGELVGEWLQLPCKDSEIKSCLDRIGINDEYEEYFITDYEINFDYKLGEYENIYMLNTLAKITDRFNSDKIAELNLGIDVFCSLHPDVVEVMNVALQLDDVGFIHLPGDDDLYIKIGYEFALADGILSVLEQFGVSSYFDFHGYGKNVAQDYSKGDDVILHSQEWISIDKFTYEEIRDMVK